MKKVLTFIAFAAAMSVSAVKAYPPPKLLDDSSSFRIARSVKLGYGDSFRSPVHGIGSKKLDIKTCSTDDQCLTTQECVNGNCKELCSPSPCSGKTPDCNAEDHAYTCKCTENSCGAGNECVDGRCETCTVGSKCNCDGEKVWGASGSCVCPDGTADDGYGSCVKNACSDSDCLEWQKCNEYGQCANACFDVKCPAETPLTTASHHTCVCECSDTSCPSGYHCSDRGVTPRTCVPDEETCPDGYLTAVTSCSDGYTFETSGSSGGKACGKCIETPCPDGYSTDPACSPGTRVTNSTVFSGEFLCKSCEPCKKGEQCSCPDGQVADGSGSCVENKTCAEMGYQDMGAWMSTCGQSGGNIKTITLASGRMCYYCENGTSCSSLNSAYFEVGTKTCASGETAVSTGKSANGKSCYQCKKSCSALGYFAQGKGNCPSNQTEVKTSVSGAEGTCYTCANKTCENSGYTSDSSKSPQPNFVVTTINGTKCYCLNCSGTGGTNSSSSSSDSSAPCSSLTTGTISNGDNVCTKKSDGSFYYSYLKLSLNISDDVQSYSLYQSGISTSLVKCQCEGKSKYGTSCVLAHCYHQNASSLFAVTGSF